MWSVYSFFYLIWAYFVLLGEFIEIEAYIAGLRPSFFSINFPLNTALPALHIYMMCFHFYFLL